jgi:hypothetical protein
MSEDVAFDCWAIVEIMGRKVIAGRVTEQVVAGCGYIRVDVPAVDDQAAFTQLVGTASIYMITPTTEEIARAYVRRNVGAPIKPYQLQMLPASVPESDDDEDMDPEREKSYLDEEPGF